MEETDGKAKIRIIYESRDQQKCYNPLKDAFFLQNRNVKILILIKMYDLSRIVHFFQSSFALEIHLLVFLSYKKVSQLIRSWIWASVKMFCVVDESWMIVAVATHLNERKWSVCTLWMTGWQELKILLSTDFTITKFQWASRMTFDFFWLTCCK